ncbi:MAG: hypothetical protein SFV15_06945 [Polyangiaceae bacterium]|nr:hypothetical protein [Polyangiaceae bacterium]
MRKSSGPHTAFATRTAHGGLRSVLILILILILPAVVLVSCGRANDVPQMSGSGSPVSNGPPVADLVIDPDTCPAEAPELSEAKLSISFEAYLRTHPDLTHSIAVKLREPRFTPPPCDGDTSDTVRCAARDEALLQRQVLNQKALECVFESFGPPGSLKQPLALWYEAPRKLESGLPVPIGVAFSALASWSQVEVVARHPYVERIEPAFRTAAEFQVEAPKIPLECPAAVEASAAKLTEARSIQGQGRRPVVVELKLELLPELQLCGSEALCDAALSSGYELTILGRRMLTCVQTFIDSKLQAPASRVAYDGATGNPMVSMPPFGDPVHAVTAFGLALTWEEVQEIAKHPFIHKIWTSDGIQVDAPPEGCPPKYDEPVALPVCPATTESVSGKFRPEEEALWKATPGPHEVMISVARSAPVCPRPDCPGSGILSCPEYIQYSDRLDAETVASQTCVRALLEMIGGEERVGVFPRSTPGILALLTWAQIQAVAAHPHVLGISSTKLGTPPP